MGAIVLKAGSGWSSFRGNVDKLVIGVDGVATTFDFEVSGADVPATAPDTMPPGLLGRSHAQIDAATGRAYIPGVIQLLFRVDTPVADRVSAVTSIGGHVVGGLRAYGDDGFYFVQVSDSTTIGPVEHAAALLTASPSVAYAGPLWDVSKDLAYLRPKDGAGWTQWAVDKDSVGSGANWGLERVAAPLAWGCTTGGTTVPIAVVDDGVGGPTPPFMFTAGDIYPDDISPNVSFLREDSNPNHPKATHGLSVTSVLAARGGDSRGMTGIMWYASLILLDRDTDPEKPGMLYPLDTLGNIQSAAQDQANLFDAGIRGAAAINYSQANEYEPFVPQYPSGPTDTLNMRFLSWRDASHKMVRETLDRLARKNLHPLLVVSAGNENLPAEWNGAAFAKTEYPDQVLVVGASDRSNAIAYRSAFRGSNRGPFIDIYAPGLDVGVYERDKAAPVLQSGTSFAAPLVTGVAGLIANFDPTITPRQLKDYIIRGSTRGDRWVDGRPLLNAYETLRLVADERPTAPLCGSRVFARNGGIYAMRGNTASLLAPIGETASGLRTYHGGSRVDYVRPNGTSASIVRSIADGTWHSQSSNVPSKTLSGSWRSTQAQSHDGDSSVVIAQYPFKYWWDGLAIFAYRQVVGSPDSTLVASKLDEEVPSVLIPPGGFFWAVEWTTGDGSGGLVTYLDQPVRDSIELTRRPVIAYAPTGGRYVVAHNRQTTISHGAANSYVPNWEVNPPNSYIVHDASFEQQARAARVYVVTPGTTSSTTFTKIWDSTAVNVYGMAISEDGRTVGITVGSDTTRWVAYMAEFTGVSSESTDADLIDWGYDWAGHPHTTVVARCKIVYRSLLPPYASEGEVDNVDGCAFSGESNSFSPYKASAQMKRPTLNRATAVRAAGAPVAMHPGGPLVYRGAADAGNDPTLRRRPSRQVRQ